MNFEHYDLAIRMVDVYKNWRTYRNTNYLEDITVRFIRTCCNLRKICLLLTRDCCWQFSGLESLTAIGVNLIMRKL